SSNPRKSRSRKSRRRSCSRSSSVSGDRPNAPPTAAGMGRGGRVADVEREAGEPALAVRLAKGAEGKGVAVAGGQELAVEAEEGVPAVGWAEGAAPAGAQEVGTGTPDKRIGSMTCLRRIARRMPCITGWCGRSDRGWALAA